MNVRALLAPPRLLSVVSPRTPLTDAQALRPVRLLAEGLGVLTIEGGPRLLVFGRFAGLVFTRAQQDVIEVRFSGPRGTAREKVRTGPVLGPGPRRVAASPGWRDAEWPLPPLEVDVPTAAPGAVRAAVPATLALSVGAPRVAVQSVLPVSGRALPPPRVTFLSREDV